MEQIKQLLNLEADCMDEQVPGREAGGNSTGSSSKQWWKLLLGLGCLSGKPTIRHARPDGVFRCGRLGIHHIHRKWTLKHHFEGGVLIDTNILPAGKEHLAQADSRAR